MSILPASTHLSLPPGSHSEPKTCCYKMPCAPPMNSLSPHIGTYLLVWLCDKCQSPSEGLWLFLLTLYICALRKPGIRYKYLLEEKEVGSQLWSRLRRGHGPLSAVPLGAIFLLPSPYTCVYKYTYIPCWESGPLAQYKNTSRETPQWIPSGHTMELGISIFSSAKWGNQDSSADGPAGVCVYMCVCVFAFHMGFKM